MVKSLILAMLTRFPLTACPNFRAFGAITNQNIHDALTAQGVEVDRRAIELEKPIKSEGEHEVAIKVHPQVEATLKVVVKENA